MWKRKSENAIQPSTIQPLSIQPSTNADNVVGTSASQSFLATPNLVFTEDAMEMEAEEITDEKKVERGKMAWEEEYVKEGMTPESNKTTEAPMDFTIPNPVPVYTRKSSGVILPPLNTVTTTTLAAAAAASAATSAVQACMHATGSLSPHTLLASFAVDLDFGLDAETSTAGTGTGSRRGADAGAGAGTSPVGDGDGDGDAGGDASMVMAQDYNEE